MSGSPAVIVLAAGAGARFQGDQHKLLQHVGDSSVLGMSLRCAVASPMSVVVVTTEALASAVRRHVASRDVVVVPAANGADGAPVGMGHSIAAGVAARPHASGWLVLPGDMPMVKTATLLAVANALSHHPIAYAQHRGRRGHPVGFGIELYSELLALRGDQGARRLVARYPSHGVEVDDAGVLIDVDTQADLVAVRGLHSRHALL